MSSERLSSTSGAAKRRAKKRKADEMAKVAGSMNKFISVKEPALAVEPLIDDTTSKQPLSTTVETTVDTTSQTTERGETQNDEQSNQNVAIHSNTHLMGSEIDKKLDTSNENDEIINMCNKEASSFEDLNSEIHPQSTLSHKIHSHTEADEDCGKAENESPSWVICAAKASLLGDLTLELQTLASKVKNDNFNLSEFLVQAAELSECSQRIASDLCTEAQKALKEYQQTIHFECACNKEDDLVDHDPGKRPQKLSENQKKYLISLGPCQPQLSSFPKKKELEKCSKQCKFSAAWYSEFPHLEYSVSKDAAYCFVCSLFPEGPGRAKADPAWVQGNNTWSKMKGSLGRNKEGKLECFSFYQRVT